MELREFVAQALVEIVGGVTAAQVELGRHGAKVNPRMIRVLPKAGGGYVAHGWAAGEHGNPVMLVDFDVAVVASEGASKRGGIGVAAGLVGLGGSTSSDTERSSTSRLRFMVPLMLPAHEARRSHPDGAGDQAGGR
jgi:hypothetical protein